MRVFTVHRSPPHEETAMTSLVAMVTVTAIIPLLVFVGIVFAIWSVLSMISARNSKALDRLARLSRPPSLADIEDPRQGKNERFAGLLETAKAISAPLMPNTEVEQSQLK